MKQLSLKTDTGRSQIYFSDIFSLSAEKNSLAVFDTHTERLFGKYFSNQNAFTFNAGEDSKNIETVTNIFSYAIEKKLNRTSTFYAVGGGVVCDITAFCASVFKRGVQLVLIPTSLLAMVDASIGGKTGFDFAGVKNAVGSFFYAQKIYIFFDCLKTLSAAEYKNGLAEILKIGMLAEKKIIKLFENQNRDEFFMPSAILKKLIYLAVQAKIKIAQKDFYEKNIRMFLNLGHTFAHALESLSAFEIPHGEAVGWGLAQALRLGLSVGITESPYAEKIFALLRVIGYKTEFYDHTLLHDFKLTKSAFVNALIDAMRNDKKNSDERVSFILQKKLGKNFIYKITCTELAKIFSEKF